MFTACALTPASFCVSVKRYLGGNGFERDIKPGKAGIDLLSIIWLCFSLSTYKSTFTLNTQLLVLVLVVVAEPYTP